jgi:hypothetical protein
MSLDTEGRANLPKERKQAKASESKVKGKAKGQIDYFLVLA